MRMIPTRIHGIADYLGGLLLLLAPNLLGFSEADAAAAWVPRILGVAFLGLAVLTRYELGLIKVIPMSVHLMVDYLASAFLIISPWLFGFADEPSNVWLPHVVLGVAYLLISLMTRTEPETDTTRSTTRTT
jgi:hypothetical protein